MSNSPLGGCCPLHFTSRASSLWLWCQRVTPQSRCGCPLVPRRRIPQPRTSLSTVAPATDACPSLCWARDVKARLYFCIGAEAQLHAPSTFHITLQCLSLFMRKSLFAHPSRLPLTHQCQSALMWKGLSTHPPSGLSTVQSLSVLMWKAYARIHSLLAGPLCSCAKRPSQRLAEAILH